MASSSLSSFEAAQVLQAVMSLPTSAPPTSTTPTSITPTSTTPTLAADVPPAATITTTAATTAARGPYQVTIKAIWETEHRVDIWEAGTRVDTARELDYFLEYCTTHNIQLSEPVQTMHLNPMEVQSMAEFEDKIGHMYSFIPLGITLHDKFLAWEGPGGRPESSSMRREWETTRKTLMNPSNTNFVLRVIFRCVGEAGGLINQVVMARSEEWHY
ncbi:hypothetical protein N7512_007097 [Penicillium capsulatum]|nr:hypothetical protein N7512_007097 [Penicillium capsulatum]